MLYNMFTCYVINYITKKTHVLGKYHQKTICVHDLMCKTLIYYYLKLDINNTTAQS